MRKVVTLVGLALAAVFAVAAGDNEIKISPNVSAKIIFESSKRYMKSVTLTDSGSPVVSSISKNK